MNKVYDKLASLIASEDPSTAVNLHVILQKNLTQGSTEALIQNLSQLATDKDQVKVFPLSGIVTFTTTLDSIERIAGNANVVWVDRDSEAPLEELLDEQP